MKRLLPFLIIAVVAAAALTGGTLFYRAKVAQLTPQGGGAARTEIDTQGMHVRGNPKAKVTIEEFGDFQCPPCGTLSGVLARMEHDYGDDLRVIFRNFPLPMHNHAKQAAEAAEAAGLQGKFWQMHDVLYRNQIAWSKETDATPIITAYAEGLGLDMERFHADMASEQVRERIEADTKLGDSLGVTSTPSLFINQQPLSPVSFNEPALRAAIAAVLRGEALPIPANPTPFPMPSVSPMPSPTPSPAPES